MARKNTRGNRNPPLRLLLAPFRFGFAQNYDQRKSQLLSLILSSTEEMASREKCGTSLTMPQWTIRLDDKTESIPALGRWNLEIWKKSPSGVREL